nr:MAG TPA: hypothetical protein [Caudoviricetes sp.]
MCFGLEDRRGRHRLTPHNFCERHPAKCGVPFAMPARCGFMTPGFFWGAPAR